VECDAVATGDNTVAMGDISSHDLMVALQVTCVTITPLVCNVVIQAIMLHRSKGSEDTNSSTPSSPTESLHHNNNNNDVTNN